MKAKLGKSVIPGVLKCLGIDASFVERKDGAGRRAYLIWDGDKPLERWHLVMLSEPPVKRYHVHGEDKNLNGLIHAIAHDVQCGCESCVSWLIRTIEDNAVTPDSSYLEYLKRIYEDLKTREDNIARSLGYQDQP